MDVVEGSGVVGGNYDGTFVGFLKTTGKPQSYIHQQKTDTGGAYPVVRYLIGTKDGLEIPGSFPWDLDDYRARSTLGALGAPASAVKDLLASHKVTLPQLFSRLEAKLQSLAVPVSVWVPEGREWAGTIRPTEGSFQVQFVKISTRDENDNPIHEVKHRTFKVGGRTQTSDDDVFSCILVVTAGQHEGAAFYYQLHYKILNEKGVWKVVKKGARGLAFYEFFASHGIRLEEFDPDSDFADPHNGLPEFEPLLAASGVQLVAQVQKSWITKLTPAPTAIGADFLLEETGVARTRGPVKTTSTQPGATKRVETVSPYVGFLKQVINRDTGRVVFGQQGELQAPKKWWAKYVHTNNLPGTDVTAYTTKQIYSALIQLGHNDLAKNIRLKVRGK